MRSWCTLLSCPASVASSLASAAAGCCGCGCCGCCPPPPFSPLPPPRNAIRAQIIANAEADIKAKTEKVLSSVVQATGDIPEVGRGYRYDRDPRGYDQYGGSRGAVALAAPPVSRVRARVESAREMDYINNPNNDMARRYLQERFGIPNSLPRPGEVPKDKRRRKRSKKKNGGAKTKGARRPVSFVGARGRGERKGSGKLSD